MMKKKAFDIFFIGSTGRTATTFISTVLNQIEGVVAFHEGHYIKNEKYLPVLPLINLENKAIYHKKIPAQNVVDHKRSKECLFNVLKSYKANYFFEVAYYNPMLGLALMQTYNNAKYIGVIRDCASFVRSSTTLVGEDPMPVGWPDEKKNLSEREIFISLGRIKPKVGDDDFENWKNWTPIMKNIWLWRETNRKLLEIKSNFADRTILVDFNTLKNNPRKFWQTFVNCIPIPGLTEDKILILAESVAKSSWNKKSGGYQIDPFDNWNIEEQDFANVAQEEIDKNWRNLNG